MTDELPSEAQIEAGRKALEDAAYSETLLSDSEVAERVYLAMQALSPQPPAETQPSALGRRAMTDEPLKACPLCGRRDECDPSVSASFKYAEPGNPDAGLVPSGNYIECANCGCCGPNRPTEAEAIAAWNTRAEPQGAIIGEGMATP